MTNDDDVFAVEIDLQIAVFGYTVVPADKSSRRQNIRQVFSVDVQLPVFRRAVTQHHRVVRASQILQFNVAANRYVAVESDAVAAGRVRERVDDILQERK